MIWRLTAFLHIIGEHGEMNRWLKHQPKEIHDQGRENLNQSRRIIKSYKQKKVSCISRHHCSGSNLVEDARISITPPGAETTSTTRRSSERTSARLLAAQPHHAMEVAPRSSPSKRPQPALPWRTAPRTPRCHDPNDGSAFRRGDLLLTTTAA